MSHVRFLADIPVILVIVKFQFIFSGAANLIKGCGLDENKPE